MDRNIFEKKIAPILTYIGTIGAIIMSVAYIVVVMVLIFGFKAEGLLMITVFAVVNAAVGFCIMQFLKVQGQSWAKDLPENKEVLQQYYNTKTKDKKLHSMTYYWVTSVIKDVFIKAATLAISTIGVIYLVIEGSRDYTLILLAVVNLLMFVCFGLLSLNKAYEFFNNVHIPYIKEQLKQVSHEEVEKEKKEECLTLETENSETCKSK